MKDQEQPYQLLLNFVRALSHKLRTPLSVVSNNLQGLGSDAPGVQQSLKKIDFISQLLVELNALSASEIAPRAERPEVLCRILRESLGAESCERLTDPQGSADFIKCDPESILCAFRALMGLLIEYSSNRTPVCLELAGSDTLTFRFLCPALTFEWFDGIPPEAASVSELFNRRLDFDSPFAALIDGILIANGWSFSAEIGAICITAAKVA